MVARRHRRSLIPDEVAVDDFDDFIAAAADDAAVGFEVTLPPAVMVLSSWLRIECHLTSDAYFSQRIPSGCHHEFHVTSHRRICTSEYISEMPVGLNFSTVLLRHPLLRALDLADPRGDEKVKSFNPNILFLSS